MWLDRDTNKCFDKDIFKYLDKYQNKHFNKYKDIDKHKSKRVDKHKTKGHDQVHPSTVTSGAALAPFPHHLHAAPTQPPCRSHPPHAQKPFLTQPPSSHYAAPTQFQCCCNTPALHAAWRQPPAAMLLQRHPHATAHSPHANPAPPHAASTQLPSQCLTLLPRMLNASCTLSPNCPHTATMQQQSHPLAAARSPHAALTPLHAALMLPARCPHTAARLCTLSQSPPRPFPSLALHIAPTPPQRLPRRPHAPACSPQTAPALLRATATLMPPKRHTSAT